MSIRALWIMALWAGTAFAASDDDPLPPNTKIHILNIESRIVDMGGGSRTLASPGQGLSGSGVSTRENSEAIVIDLSADVLFDFDRADLRAGSLPSVQSTAQFIAAHAKRNVMIEGYTDAKGSDAYNQKLSFARAESVHRWLMKQAALSSINFAVTGRGANNPVASNTTPDGGDDPVGRQKNRRVEITISK